MRWSYKTVYFGLKKDGLLGSAFLDDAEIEETLNEYGQGGWELVSMFETRDGVISVFKQPFGLVERVKQTVVPSVEKVARPVIEPQSPAVQPKRQHAPEKQVYVPEPEEEPYEEEDDYPIVDTYPKVRDKRGTEDDTEDSDSGIGSIRIE